MFRRGLEKLSQSLQPAYGPATLMNRPMRTRLWGGVGAGGEKPRLPDYFCWLTSLPCNLNLLGTVAHFRDVVRLQITGRLINIQPVSKNPTVDRQNCQKQRCKNWPEHQTGSAE